MKYFGIKTPGDASYIWWIATDKHQCWGSFFQYPDKNDKMNSHRLPMSEAIRAYESIGYKCVELDVREIK